MPVASGWPRVPDCVSLVTWRHLVGEVAGGGGTGRRRASFVFSYISSLVYVFCLCARYQFTPPSPPEFLSWILFFVSCCVTDPVT